jgi:isopropylmalate/homocitrate/citramalate synthase
MNLMEGLEAELTWSSDRLWWNGCANRDDMPTMPRRVTLCDETLREGEESPGVYLELEDRLRIADSLIDLGVPEIEIGYPGAIKEHFEFSRALKAQHPPVKLVSHTRTYTKSNEWRGEIERAVEAGSDILCLVASMSKTLEMTTPWLRIEDTPDRIAQCVEYASELGVTCALALVDCVRTPRDRFLLANNAAVSAGAKRVYVMDGQGGCLPHAVRNLTRALVQAVGPDVEVAVHCHDDFGMATANTLAAIEEGATVADVVFHGLGDKAGIGATEEIAMALELLYNVDTGIKLERLGTVSALIEEVFRLPVAANKSIVGPNTVRHQIDAHIATVLRGVWWAWESWDPALMKRERRLEWAHGKVRAGRSGALAAKLEAMGVSLTDDQWERLQARLNEGVRANRALSEMQVESLISEVLATP